MRRSLARLFPVALFAGLLITGARSAPGGDGTTDLIATSPSPAPSCPTTFAKTCKCNPCKCNPCNCSQKQCRCEADFLEAGNEAAAPPALPAAPAFIPTAEKIAHLEQAAHHLAAAGLIEEADEIRDEAERLLAEQQKQRHAGAMLKQKMAELERLQAEVDELRATAGESEQIRIHLQVVQVSVAKLHAAGLDFPSLAACQEDDRRCPGACDVMCPSDACRGETQRTLAKFFEMLERQHVSKVLAAPTLIVADNRPVSFTSGGEIPIPVPQSEGTVSIQFQKVGTHAELLPKLLGANKVRLTIHARQDEINSSLSESLSGLKVPAVRTLELDSEDLVAELGQTTVLGELAQPVAQLMAAGGDGKSPPHADDVRTFFLVTPELVSGELAQAPTKVYPESASTPAATRVRYR